jgi:hypothetical protein
MIELRASLKDGADDQSVRTPAELESTMALADDQARSAGILTGIKLRARNGDELLVLVGGDDTVLGFNYGHGDPPYLASLGLAESDQPVLTAYIGQSHHTEFSRRHVVPMEVGRVAALEFLRTGARPTSVRWVET